MSTATKALRSAKFLSAMYVERARILYSAHVRGDLFSRLNLPNGNTDPYQVYEEMRARGPMLPTRLGNYSTTSHRLCNEVLRSRKFGPSPDDESEDLRTRPASTSHYLSSTRQTTPESAD
jgi:cytochrome P450